MTKLELQQKLESYLSDKLKYDFVIRKREGSLTAILTKRVKVTAAMYASQDLEQICKAHVIAAFASELLAVLEDE